MTPDTTTTLAQNLFKDQDTIYVANATALTQPDLQANIWGVITINGERIISDKLTNEDDFFIDILLFFNYFRCKQKRSC